MNIVLSIVNPWFATKRKLDPKLMKSSKEILDPEEKKKYSTFLRLERSRKIVMIVAVMLFAFQALSIVFRV